LLEICETSWGTLWLRKDKVLKLSIETHLSFLEVYSTSFQLISFRKPLSNMQNNFSYENNQHYSFQMDYNCYPEQLHDSYNYQQQIVTPTSAPDLSRLTIRQLNDLQPRSSFVEYEQLSYHEQQPYSECPPQPSYVPFGSQQQQHATSQQVVAINGPSYKEVVLLMDGLREKLDTIDERLRVDQRCKDIEQKWYENDKVLYDMMEDASNNNSVELLCTVNSTLQCHPRFAEISEFRAFRQEIEVMLLKLAI